MFISKEILQAIVFATIIGIFIVIGFAIYSPKTSFDACIDTYTENRMKDTHYWRDGEKFAYSKEKIKNREPDDYRYQAFASCRKLR